VVGADPATRPASTPGPLIEGSATMPPRARTGTVKKADEPSVVDAMVEDAEQVTAPPEYPAGAPEFKVLLAVRPRGRRADFKRLLASIAEKSPELRERQEALSALTGKSEREAASYRLWADMDEVNELVEDALRIAAVDLEKFDTWATEASDEDLQATWVAYQSRAQPGEASSSTS
jgi:hypothetical protein